MHPKGHGWGHGHGHGHGYGHGQMQMQGQMQGQMGFQQNQGYNQSLFQGNIDYVITSALNDNMALDVSGNPADKNKLILWTKHGNGNQRFKIRYQNGLYQLASHNGKNVEVVGGSNDKGAGLHANNLNNSPSEIWAIEPAQGHPNGYIIRSFCGQVMDVNQNNAIEGQTIIQWDYNGGKNQIWHFHPQGAQSLFKENQEYIITSALNDTMALDVSGNPADKNKLILWTKHGNGNQRFKIRHQNGKYQLASHNGKNVEIVGGSSNKGTGLHANNLNNSPSQIWEIEPAQGHNNGYVIKSFCGQVMDVNQNNAIEGQTIIQWDYNGGKNQIWYINPA